MAAARRKRPVDGILLVDKPAGPTSNDVVVRVRRALAARKAGHAGSLDPAATRLLAGCFGRATAALAFLLESDKSYRTTARFGRSTTTGDAEGDVVARAPAEHVDAGAIERTIATHLRGEIEQIPPMYSALKVGGRRLHELARAGEVVDRRPRRVVVHRFELITFRPGGGGDDDLPEADLEVHCSKGTYVRTLVEDLGELLGTRAHVAALHRSGVGPWPAGRAVHALAEVERVAAAEGPEACDRLLLGIESAFAELPAVPLDGARARRFAHGNAVPFDAALLPDGSASLLRVRTPGADDGTFVGLAAPVDDASAGCVLRPRRVFVDPDAVG